MSDRNNSQGGNVPNSSQYSPFTPYEITYRGTNSQGNQYDNRNQPSGSGYRYKNQDGSWYYGNGDGSKYYNNGRGQARYTAPNGVVYDKSTHSSTSGTSPGSGSNGGYGGRKNVSNDQPAHGYGSGGYQAGSDQARYQTQQDHRSDSSNGGYQNTVGYTGPNAGYGSGDQTASRNSQGYENTNRGSMGHNAGYNGGLEDQSGHASESSESFESSGDKAQDDDASDLEESGGEDDDGGDDDGDAYDYYDDDSY